MAIDFDRLTKARNDLNLTKTELAEILNINARTYSSYELGERDPSTEVLLKLCKVLDLSADELLGMGSTQIQKKIATINGKIVYMIPIFEIDSVDFESDFVDIMPWFFADMTEAKATFAIKASGDSMYPKIEKNDILVISTTMNYHNKDLRYRENDLLLFCKDGVNYIRRVNKARKQFILEAINPNYPPIDATGALEEQIHKIGTVRKIIKTI